MSCSPGVPNDNRFHIPVQVLSDRDVESLTAMQTALEGFGFEEPFRRIASFIYNTPLFTAVLGSNIYPVLLPTNRSAIYQIWS